MTTEKKTLITLLVLPILLAGVLLFIWLKPQTATGYQDMRGVIYECSKPIEVANQGATHVFTGEPSPTPHTSSRSC